MKNTEEIFYAIIEEAVGKLLSTVANNMRQPNFNEIVKATQEAVNRLGTRLIEEIVTLTDERYNTQRDIHAVILRHTKTRKLISQMGELNLTRRLYFDKKTEKYFFAADQILGIEKYSRIEKDLKAKLISDATLTSYGKASALSNHCVSRQTVSNLVKQVSPKNLAVHVEEHNRQVDKIYIEADEDHIHLNDGRSAEVKLVYVHEGRKRLCKGRTQLINARYFATVGGGTEIWNTVSDYLYSQYAVRGAEIHLSGDGATWIKCGMEVIPRMKYHIDKFHIFKSITDATAGNKRLRRQILNSIKSGDRMKVKSFYMQQWKTLDSVQKRKRLADSMYYIDNNFKSIDLTSEYSCSAEGHVSHVLSSRLSSRPMAWSLKGAEKMAQLRTYYFNQGDFKELIQTTKEDTKRKKYNFPTHEVASCHEIPHGRIVGLDGITDEVSRILRSIFKK